MARTGDGVRRFRSNGGHPAAPATPASLRAASFPQDHRGRAWPGSQVAGYRAAAALPSHSQRPRKSTLTPVLFFDPMTQFQSKRLDDDGRSHSRHLTKGQASDLIGLSEQADEDQLEVLRFSKRPSRGMNQSRARHEIALLIQDESARSAWEGHPMTARQKDFFRFFGVRTSAGLLNRDADQLIAGRIQTARAEGDPLFDQWSAYEGLLDDFDDADFRDGYGIKKTPIAAIRNAINASLAEGKSWDDLDNDTVGERLLDVNPNLER